MAEGGKVEGFIDVAQPIDGISLKLFEAEFMEVALGNQVPLFEECLVDLLVLPDDPVVEVAVVSPLQRQPG
jgi:hypothetical protein